MTPVRAAALVMLVGGCAMNPRIPSLPLPQIAPSVANRADSALADSLAPVLHVQRDEVFPLVRVVAVVDPDRPVIGYHLLWQHDLDGQWVPWAKPSDEEEVWVGYDAATHAPTDLWTYWHGTILHADWRANGPPAVDVQWGKHGSLPAGTVESDLPGVKKLNDFYAATFILLPDIWAGAVAHGGPLGFFHSYARYRDFSRVVPLTGRLDAVVRTADPRDALHAVFGPRYSNKILWP